MKHALTVSTFLAAMAATVALNPAPALAAGCGGMVNVFYWGCAPWDQNPRCPWNPDCRTPRVSVKQKNAPVPAIRHNGRQAFIGSEVIATVGPGGRLVAQGGGNLVAQGGGNLVAQGGGNVVVQGR